jgi:hypothetical protein
MTRGSSSPTKIPHKLKPNQLYIPRGNVYRRPTEDGDDMFLGEMHHIVQAGKLGLTEAKKYLRICDAERIVIHRVQSGERIPRAVQISIIARLASTETQKVSREEVLQTLR